MSEPGRLQQAEMKTVTGLRTAIYDYHRRNYAYIFEEWRWYSYRRLKALMYMNVAPLLAYLFMKTGVKPNTVTLAYALLGIAGGILLAMPLKWLVLTGVAFFYFRPFLDWCDGLLARETGQTSVTGAVLDPFGAHVGWVALWVGMGFYLYSRSGELLFLYLLPVLPAIFAMNVVTSMKAALYDDHLLGAVRRSAAAPAANAAPAASASSGLRSIVGQIVVYINSRFEHNAGFVDLICLVIVIELFLPIFVSWSIYFLFLGWQIVYFAILLYLVARGGWVEQQLEGKVNELRADE